MYKKKILYLFFMMIFFVFFNSCEKDIPINSCEFQDDSVKVDSLKINNKVVIIGVDGFRSDAMTQAITPSIYEFSQRNVYKNLSHLTEEDTYSGPNWSSILTGVHYNKHNVTDNSFDGSLFDMFPTFLYYIENNVNSINTSSIVNWLPINQKILSKNVDYTNSQISDSLVFVEALNLLLNNEPIKPDILFLHFDELDAAGHNYGFSPNIIEYTKTLKNIDLYVDSLVTIIDNKRLFGENWMCILVSDHGGDGYSHGDYNNIKIRETVLIVEHPSQNFKLKHKSNMTDIAPTILDFLGISSAKFDCSSDGQSILE
jgi:predicted AlkP superfamily pyrophosphatase or phosphodiesterase